MTTQLPLFEVPAPALFRDPQAVLDLLLPVLEDLADVVGRISPEQLALPTPCRDYDVAGLRDHVLAWLQFFADALADPNRQGTRIDPQAYRAAQDPRDLAEVVRAAAGTIGTAVRGGVLTGEVVMSQARMTGPSVLGMTLGEYVVHGSDLARATGAPWAPATAAVEAAHTFFAGMVTPQYRGPDGGFFDHEVPVPADAPALDRLLGFAGRRP